MIAPSNCINQDFLHHFFMLFLTVFSGDMSGLIFCEPLVKMIGFLESAGAVIVKELF